MTMELRGDGGQQLAIERSSLGAPGTPASEDLLLNVTVKVYGYTAADQAWVMANDWRRFLSELLELERLRHGHATLEGASPRKLKLVIKTTDCAGHMAVSGFLGWDTPDGFAQKLEFGFAFDAGMLQTVVRGLEELGQ
jgi:hypothetical protein